MTYRSSTVTVAEAERILKEAKKNERSRLRYEAAERRRVREAAVQWEKEKATRRENVEGQMMQFLDPQTTVSYDPEAEGVLTLTKTDAFGTTRTCVLSACGDDASFLSISFDRRTKVEAE